MNVYDRLRELGVELGAVSVPAASYAPFTRAGNLLFLSGHLARWNGQIWTGRLGGKMSLDEGREAARSTAIDLLSTMHAAVGDLNKIKAIVKLTAMINSSTTFSSQHLVANGASDFLGEVFPGRGPHSRSAYGVAQLPLRACVEIELIAEVEGDQSGA